MLKGLVFVLAVLSGVLLAKGANAVWDYSNRSFVGRYALYGGHLGEDARAPESGDRKVAFSVKGRAAQEIYDAIGPSGGQRATAERACPERPEITLRERDALVCRRHLKEGHWCTFGFDLSTGLSTWGVRGGGICSDTPP